MYYDDLDYANKRLSQTLVRKRDGTPFLVAIVVNNGKDFICRGENLMTSTPEDVSLSNIDLTPVPLGFFNHEGKMYFSCRKPMRKDWKQGLSLQSLVVYGATRKLGFKVLVQPILNTYPNFVRALEIVNRKTVTSVAFSRDFGLSKQDDGLSLLYRKFTVGKVVRENLVLNRDKFFLDQHLSEALS